MFVFILILAVLIESFWVFMALFFGSVPFFALLTKDLRTQLQTEMGYRPSLKSTELWEAIKQARKTEIKIKCAFYLGWWMRIMAVLVLLSAFAQMVWKDVNVS